MYEEMRVKYLFVNMKYPLYLKLQGLLIVSLIIAAAACYFLIGDSSIWVVKDAWLICLILAGLEVFEAAVAIGKAKKNFNPQN